MDPARDWKELLKLCLDVWRFEIFSVDNSPITLGKLVVGLTLFVVGIYVCRRLAKRIEEKFLSRFDLDSSVRYNLGTLSFYILLIFLTLFVLRLLNVPLTVFTVLGGTLAIGLGFGSQNIVNNFISGLIIMFEKPVRVGDYIELDNLSGTVEEIGARSTIVKSPSNTQIVVPNSFFLEKSIINWTLSDPIVRAKVSVGVAYGCSTRKVEGLLHESVKDVPQVSTERHPLVILAEFGDNAILFDLFYWVRVDGALPLMQVASIIRFRIEELFRENKVDIAFPQRDLHIDTPKPIRVELTHSPGAPT